MSNNCCRKSCGCQRDCGCQDTCCRKPMCGCKKPVLEVEEVPESVSTLRFNANGASTWYDYRNMIYQTQTDTTISVDVLKRALVYMAERHVDRISAQELGSILHISDIGDVNVSGVANNSLFVYQKDANCGEGCDGISNAWIAWNSTEHQTTSLDTVMGFDADGNPLSLQRPLSTNKFYLLGWGAQDKLKYITPTAFGSVTDKKPLYIDPATGEIGYQA